MKWWMIIAVFSTLVARAEEIEYNVSFKQNYAGSRKFNCKGVLGVEDAKCFDTDSPNQVRFQNQSFSDWAGSVFRVQMTTVINELGWLEESAKERNTGGHVENKIIEGDFNGYIRFTYSPPKNLKAFAIKQTKGGELEIEGAISDSSDAEGRRIISIWPGRTITMSIAFNVSYEGEASENSAFLIEIEPTEYAD